MGLEKLDTWYASSDSIEYRGQRLQYLDNGNNDQPALVMLHGFPNSSWGWEKLWGELAPSYRLIAPDFIGYGRSSKPQDYAYSVADQARQATALLVELGISQAHLLAHSSGISVLQELLALKYLDNDTKVPRILSATFLNGGVVPSNAPTIIEQRLVQAQGNSLAEVLNVEFLNNVINTLSGPKCNFDTDEAALIWEQVSRDGGLKIASQLLHYVNERAEHKQRWETALEQTTVPMLVVLGLADPVWGLAQHDALRERWPMIEVATLESIGHFPQVHAADRVAEEIESFHLGLPD